MKDQEETLEVDEGVTREVKQLIYLGDMLDTKDGVERLVQIKLVTEWKWRDGWPINN